MNFAGKVVLVTGGSRGIGRAISRMFAENGADVIIGYKSRADAANEVVELIRETGRKALAVESDVSIIQDVERLKRITYQEFGRCDVLICNAGIIRDKSFKKMTHEMWDDVIRTNLNGPYYCSKVFIDDMAERGYGKILFISSMIGQIGNFGQANYAASKAGLLGLMKSLAKEYARKKININAVAPGFIETEMILSLPVNTRQEILSEIPLGRFGKPEEIARAALYLCSDDAQWITGQILAINGGQYM